MRWRPKAPGVGGRVLGAFAVVILAFGAAAGFSLRAQQRALARLDEVSDEEAAARTALRLSTAVRHLYIHQSHAILIGGEHPQYELALRDVAKEVAEARASPVFARNPEKAAAIASAVAALERVFREQIVPAIAAADWAKVRSEHVRSERVIADVVEHADALERAAVEQVARVRATADGEAARLRALTVTLLLVAVVVAALVALYLERTIARPIRGLTAGAQRVGGGDLGVRLEVQSRDEVGELAGSFNRMTAALAENQARLVAAEKLAALGRMAAGVAHELNNPLGVAKGYVRLMRREAPAAVRGDLEIVDSEIARCQQIVEELLGLARDSRDELVEQVDLAAVAREVVERQRAVDPGEGPAVELDAAMPELPVSGDANRLSRVVTNLLRNAVEAAGRGGAVRVSGGQRHDAVWVAVEDTGPGVPKEVRERLFEPFFTTKAKGTGLGLAASQAIARAHRGTIELEDRPGGGARFVLRLPRA